MSERLLNNRSVQFDSGANAEIPPNYIPEIDSLRAIAVLSVVIFHLNKNFLPGGFIGVDMFFVISGYVISRSLARSKAISLSMFLLDFYKRRILRILPALIACLVLTSIASALLIPHGFWLSDKSDWTGLWAFFGVSNFYLVSSLDGYFSDRVHFNPFTHTWSLAVEEQFYLFFPILFFFWLHQRSHDRNRFLALASLPLVAILSLFWAAYETNASPASAFYLLPSRFWELASGAILFQNTSSLAANGNFSSKLSWVGAVILAFGFIFAEEQHFPFPWALAPVLSTTLLIACATTKKDKKWPIGRLLTMPGASLIGRMSYSIYLWHWPVFVMFRWTIGLETLGHGLLALILTFLFGALSYNYVELSFRSNPTFTKQKSWKIVSLGIVTTVSAFLLVKKIDYHTPALSLSVTRDACVWLPYHNECDSSPVASRSDRNLFVLGDSHAGAYQLMAHSAAKRLGANVYVRSFSGCPILKLISVSASQSCKNYELDVLAWLAKEARPGDIVFLASLRLRRLADQWSTFNVDAVVSDDQSTSQQGVEREALSQAEELIRKLRSTGLNVLIDAPKPIFKSPLFRCSDWFNRDNPICNAGFSIERSFMQRYRERTMTSLQFLKNQTDIYIWDPFPVLCPNETCSALDDSNPLFFDGDHLSGYGNRKLVDSFTDQLKLIWGVHN